ncbi:MAG TPA: AMP-binding protein, partial [Candidatus Acidoferrum sp.]|nr:AMP-binding protein [Candidatus Acidoferrum sp.]
MSETIAEFFSHHFQAHRQERAYRQRRGYRTESFTYGEIQDMASGFARKLQARGIVKGDRVMLWGENGAEWVSVFFGCALSGVVVVPMDDGSAPDFAMRVFQ